MKLPDIIEVTRASARVANVVNPSYTVVAKFPKKYLPGK